MGGKRKRKLPRRRSQHKKRSLQRRKRKKRSLRKMTVISTLHLQSPSKRILLPICPKVLLILRSGRGFIPTMTRTRASSGSGSILITRISIWRGDYKYNDELTMVFMSCNLIGGMFQRLEKLKKNAFASCCLFGENNNSSISGIWVFKGQELAFDLSEDWQIDSPSYAWKKLDPASEETKKLVKDYFKWEGTDAEGRPFNQGKIFK